MSRRTAVPRHVAPGFALLVVGLLLAAPGARAQRVEVSPSRSFLIGGRSHSPVDAAEPSLLPLVDEQTVERARTLVRAGQPAGAARLIEDLERRHPDDLDVILVRAELMARQDPPPAAGKFLDAQVKHSAVSRALRDRPYRAGLWARFTADSYAAAGLTDEATGHVLTAWERSAEQGAWARVRLEQWHTGRLEVLAREYARLADRLPTRLDLVLEAARVEALVGRIKPAVERVRRAETRPDSTAAPGSLLWQLVLSLRARGDVAERAADSALVVLARGESYDAGLRERAVERLFEDRQPNLPIVSSNEWIEGAITFLEPGVIAQPGEAAAKARPVDPELAARQRLRALEAVWRGLPAGPDQVRRGLELADRLAAVGESDAARRVARDAATLAGRVPGAAADPEVSGRLALERGRVALLGGELAAAARIFDAVAASEASERVREEAAFEACEARFFAGDFDSAAAGYDAFARAWPGSPRANDALERAYLVEGSGDGPPAGLVEFAGASLAARAGRYDEAQAKAVAAESRALGGPAWSTAGLLVAGLLETQGRLAEAAEKARLVAETVPNDRLAPTARRRAGDLWLAAGDPAAALGQYEELLVRYPRSWLAPETRRRVRELRDRLGGTP